MNFGQARAEIVKLLAVHGHVENSHLLEMLKCNDAVLHLVRENLVATKVAEDANGIGLVARPSDAVVRPRVFISYGRSDAAGLATRLEKDLAEAGFDPWLDTTKLKAGTSWQHEIVDGLRAAQVVVALMTPHSVRTTRDPENVDRTDSVCLGEIAFALFNPPPQPVIPVMAQTADPPLAIFHLDYVDLRTWRESEAEYQSGLQRLIGGIHTALRGEKRYRRWYHQLDPLDFGPFLFTKGYEFSGREWLINRIDDWRTGAWRQRALLIKGDPGMGKSALVAKLVLGNPDLQVLAYHCCQWDHGETLNPARFVRSLAAMIASRFDAYAELLQSDPNIQAALEQKRCEAEPGSALEEGIFAPLHKMTLPDYGPRYILIDALDEALLVPSGTTTIVDLLSEKRLDHMPAWLRVVATSRKHPHVLEKLGGLRAEELDAHSTGNHQDLCNYIQQRLMQPDLAERLQSAGKSPDHVREVILAKAEGNFLYVAQTLETIERGQLALDRLDQLPPGLAGLYASRFERLFPDRKTFECEGLPLLECLTAAFAPLPQDFLLTAASTDQRRPRVMLHELKQFLHQTSDPPSLRLFHKSLADWLTGPNSSALFAVDVRNGHVRLANACWNEWTEDSGRMSDYARHHLAAHLVSARQWDRMLELLSGSRDYWLPIRAALRQFEGGCDYWPSGFRRALEQSNVLRAVLFRGEILEMEKRLSEALAVYDRLRSLATPDDEHYFAAPVAMATVLDRMGRPEEGLLIVDKLISEPKFEQRYEKSFWRALYQRGIFLSQLGRFDEAIAQFDCFRGAFATKELRTSAKYQRGVVALYRNDLETAESIFRESLTERGDDPRDHRRAFEHHRLGNVCAARGDYEQARKYFEESLRISERCGDSRYAAKTRADMDKLPRMAVPQHRPSAFSQQTVIQISRSDLLRLEWSVPTWEQLSRKPASEGFVRHGGVSQGMDRVGKELKPTYSEHIAAFLENLSADDRETPRTLLAFGSRNTFQNLGLPGWHRHRIPRLLCRPDEPWQHWTYHAICKLRDGRIAMLPVCFELRSNGDVDLIVAEPSPITAEEIEWAVTGQPLIWDGVVSSMSRLAAGTYDFRHLWDLRWEAWQNCPDHTALYDELMTIFMNNLGATADVRGSLLVDLAQKRRLRTATGYLHSSIGLNCTGELLLLMKTGSLLDIGAAHHSLGSDRAILLDNGGSVGAAYWSQFAWKRSGWDAIQNQPAFLGNGSYFRPRGHSIFVAELTRDLPDGPTANVIQSTSAAIP